MGCFDFKHIFFKYVHRGFLRKGWVIYSTYFFLTNACKQLTINKEREIGQWAVYYTSPQSFLKCFLIHWLNNFGDF